jgi:hypothetical protein
MATDPYNPLVQDVVPLNEVKYAARDYPSVYDSLLRRIKIEYEGIYNDFATTAQAIMLVELMAYATSWLQWYLDRVASDCFLDTARTRAAVARLVKQIGYKMGAAAAASVNETITFPDGTPGPFTLDARWRFQGPNNLQFESYAEHIEAAALAAGATITVPIRQGETRILTYTGDGTKNQQYRLTGISTDRYLAKNVVEVWVDGMLWDEKDFLEFTKTNHYEVGYNDDPPTVQFGDGIAGNIPPVGSEVRIRFLVIDGEKGNVKANSIQESIDTLVINGEEVAIEVNNAVDSKGGTEPEDPERAKRLAPFSFAARGAAITAQDYEALSNSYTDPTYGSVAVSYAFNPRAKYEDIIFNGYIDSIETDLIDYVAAVETLEASINADAQSLSVPIAGLQSDLTDLETVRTDLATYVGGAIVQGEGARGNTTKASSSMNQAKDSATNGLNTASSLWNFVDTTGDGTWTLGDIDYTKAELVKIQDFNQQAVDRSQTAATDTASATAALDILLNDNLDPANILITESTPVPTLPSLITDMTADVAEISDTVEGTGGLQDQIEEIVGLAESLKDDDILPVLTLMHERIGELFNADCASNYVQVPILSLDVDGNYSAPSVGLMIGLQSYLEGIKEVTQQVEVVDGSSVLVPAEIRMVLDVNEDAFIKAEVISQVVATVVGMLKGRSFDSPLYLSDLYTNSKASSGGITYLNVEITGPITTPSVIDTEGNLVPAENQVVVFGTLEIYDPSGNRLY